jgi:hypothetical protein
MAYEDFIVGGVQHPDAQPEGVDVVQLAVEDVLAEDADVLRVLERGGDDEVPAIGRALEAEVGGGEVAQVYCLQRPRRVQRCAVRAQGDARPVLVGVEVRAQQAAPQPHVRPVRGRNVIAGSGLWCGAEADCGESGASGERVEDRTEESRRPMRRLRFGAQPVISSEGLPFQA